MGLDYSFLLFFKRQDPWRILEGLAEFADHTLESHTAIRYPERIMRLPFEAWAGTEDKLPIPFDDPGPSWDFMTSLYFKTDEELINFRDGYRESSEPVPERIPVGYIYLTVYRDWNRYGDAHDPGSVLLKFTAATSSMSILFAVSTSVRKSFMGLLQNYQGLYGLIDREDDAVLFWLRGVEMEVGIPDARMPLPEIEKYLGE